MDTSLVFIFLEVLAIATLKDNPINEQIRCKEMMVIGPNGEQLGVKSKQDALTLAGYAGFDLVLMSDSGNMPVCKIMDYNKFKYEKKKKTKEAQKKQREAMVETKEFRLSVNIDIHDFNTRVNNAKKAFEKGKAFIPFITCGDPSLAVTERIVYAMEEAGADLIELGIPFSDPTAEGPVIQAA